MVIPTDVEALLATLLDLGVDAALVAKGREILGHKADEIDEWNELGVALRKREEYHAALVTFDAALRRFPLNPTCSGPIAVLCCWFGGTSSRR